MGDAVVKKVKDGVGMPLGVEPRQAEIIDYPLLKTQCAIKGSGHVVMRANKTSTSKSPNSLRQWFFKNF